MSYLPLLSDDDIRFVCSIIPHEEVIRYFSRHPKDLAQIRPGFRAKTFSKSDVSKLLFNFQSKNFIQNIIENWLDFCLREIEKYYNNCIADGDDKDVAQLKTLSGSFFAPNIAVYFKLVGEERSQREMELLSASITAIRENSESNIVQNRELKSKEKELQQEKDKADALHEKLEKATASQQRRIAEIVDLKRELAELHDLRGKVDKQNKDISSAKMLVEEKEACIVKMKQELSISASEIANLKSELGKNAILQAEVIALRKKESYITQLEADVIFYQNQSMDCEKQLERLSDDLVESSSKITNLEEKVAANAQLQAEISELRKSKEGITALKSELENLIERNRVCEEHVERLKIELATAIYNDEQRQEQEKSSRVLSNVTSSGAIHVAHKPLKPIEMALFTEYIGYNLESIGIPSDAEVFNLLINHLSRICFGGVPIIANRLTGAAIAKCIANVITGAPEVKTLRYKKEISIEEISAFFESKERVVCLDNFVGNYNETELLPLFEENRNKIIFLLTAYDRTVNYISEEFLRYCHYLNLNQLIARIPTLELSEDSSTLDEGEYSPERTDANNRYADIMRKILNEINYCKSIIEEKCAEISSEQELCGSLAFDVLPYCVDVLHISPYNSSAHLGRYAGVAGRCPHRKLLKEWFAL